MKTKTIFFVLLALASSLVFSARGDDFAVYGPGTHSCGDYLEKRQNDKNAYKGITAQVYAAWVFGFASGTNFFQANK